jgi:hypothetical protein
MPLYFDMPSSYSVCGKTVVIKILGLEKMHVTVMLTVSVGGSKLPPYMTLNCKTVSEEQLLGGIVDRCQPKDWITSGLMKDWLLVA